MKLTKEIREFTVPAGELLEFKDTADMIAALLHTMPGFYLVYYFYNEDTYETTVRVAKSNDNMGL